MQNVISLNAYKKQVQPPISELQECFKTIEMFLYAKSFSLDAASTVYDDGIIKGLEISLAVLEKKIKGEI